MGSREGSSVGRLLRWGGFQKAGGLLPVLCKQRAYRGLWRAQRRVILETGAGGIWLEHHKLAANTALTLPPNGVLEHVVSERYQRTERCLSHAWIQSLFL